jgi:hypothetical protein
MGAFRFERTLLIANPLILDLIYLIGDGQILLRNLLLLRFLQ